MTANSAARRPEAPASGPLRPAVVVASLLALVGSLPTPAAGLVAQQAGPVSPDSADEIRAALEQPPGSPPPDAYDILSFPFRLATFPLLAVGWGLREVGALFLEPGRPPGPVRVALRDVHAWGAEPGFASFGPRSGPGVRLVVDRFDPLVLETGISWRGSQRHRAGLWLVEESGRYLRAGLLFRRYAEPHFWGIGPDAPRDAVLDYRWDHAEASLDAGLTAGILRLRAGIAAEQNEVGAGGDGSVPDLPEAALADTLLGAGERTRFARLEGSIDLDLTRTVFVQRRGFRAVLESTAFLGIDDTGSDFLRWRGEAHGYLPLDVLQQLALRGVVEVARPLAGRGIPFTHLASLGSDRGLRGFARDRFRDRDMVFLQGEWRYEIWRDLHRRSRVEAFVFLDLGTVAHRLTDLPGLERSQGFGMRALTPDAGLLGLAYVGFGEETRVGLDFSWPF